MNNNSLKFDAIEQAKRLHGMLRDLALYKLTMLVNEGNVEAIKFTLSQPQFKDLKISDICLAEAERTVADRAALEELAEKLEEEDY